MDVERKIVAFRVDASYEIGTGHLMRCLALANALKEQGAEVFFICRDHPGGLLKVVEAQGFSVISLPAPIPDWRPIDATLKHAAWLGADWWTDAEETLKALKGFHLDLLVVDHYALDGRWERQMRTISDRIVVVDDLADRKHDCDVLIDQNLFSDVDTRYNAHLPSKTVQLLGPTYALLHPEYSVLRPNVRIRRGPVRHVLVSFGGVDVRGLTRMTVDALLTIERNDFEADIVLSADSPDYVRIRREIAGHSGIRLHDRVESLAAMMHEADLMVGAGGTTTWERLCLGLPAIVVTMADNQHPIAEELHRRNLVHWVGDAKAITFDQLRKVIADIVETGLQAAWSERCLEVVDGLGVNRVCAVLGAYRNMPITIRQARPDDEALLLEWANDALTRQNAFNPKTITTEEHHAWFSKLMAQPSDCLLYIAETDKQIPIGQTRFARQDHRWEISYALAPSFRGFGLGRPMLAQAIETLCEKLPDVSLYGQVKLHNSASVKIFESLGFSKHRASLDRYIFECNYWSKKCR